MTTHRTLGLLASLCSIPAFAGTAAAAVDDVCLPDAQPAPNWWSNLSAFKREARWQGAYVNEIDNGTRSARIRSVWSPAGDAAYFEIRVEGDPTLDDEDAFVLAVSDDTATYPELFIRFMPVADCTNWFDCDGAGVAIGASAIEYSEASVISSISWTPLSDTNPSVDFAVAHPWVVVERSATFTWTLSFVLEVPTDGSGDFVGRRLYGNAIAYDPGYTSGTYYELPLLCESTSLSTNDCLIYSGPDPELPGDLPSFIVADGWPLVEGGACVP